MMIVRNWHKRNVRSASNIEATFSCCNTKNPNGDRGIQITIRSEEKGRLLLTMTDGKYISSLIRELQRVSDRLYADH